MSVTDTASLDRGEGAKAANVAVDDLSDVLRSLDTKAHGEYSLHPLLAGRSQDQLRDIVSAVHHIFVGARAQVREDTLGNLSALYAMFPMNTGHGGTLSTIHAKSALDALNRLSNLALSARPNLNHGFMRSETAQAIDFVLYCERDITGRRRVRELITSPDTATRSRASSRRRSIVLPMPEPQPYR